jgi:hypothetical protein
LDSPFRENSQNPVFSPRFGEHKPVFQNALPWKASTQKNEKMKKPLDKIFSFCKFILNTSEFQELPEKAKVTRRLL